MFHRQLMSSQSILSIMYNMRMIRHYTLLSMITPRINHSRNKIGQCSSRINSFHKESWRDHWQHVCKAANYHVIAARHVRKCVSEDIAKSIATSLVGARLDYCTSLVDAFLDYWTSLVDVRLNYHNVIFYGNFTVSRTSENFALSLLLKHISFNVLNLTLFSSI